MRYKSQSVAYWYFAVAMVLFGLQIVFGILSATKYLGPDPLLYILPFDITKVIHTNLLIVWVLTGFMGATYWMVPDESRTELHSVKGLTQATDHDALKARFRAEMYALLTDGGHEPGALEAGTLEDRFDREQARRHQRELRRQCDRIRLKEALGWDADLIKRLGA